MSVTPRSLVLNAFKELGMDSQKNNNANLLATYSVILNYYAGAGSLYRDQSKIFSNRFDKYKNNIMDKIFTKPINHFKIYHENEIRSFYAVDYIEEFCDNSLKNILNAFDFLNGIHIYDEVKSNSVLFFSREQIIKIFNIHLVMILAKIFCMFSECQKISSECDDSTLLLTERNSYINYIRHSNLAEKNFVAKKITGSNIKKKHLSKKNLSKIIVPAYNYFVDPFNIFFSKNDEELKKYIKENNDLIIIFSKILRNDTINRKKIFDEYISEKNLFFLTRLIDQIENKQPNRISLQLQHVDMPKYLVIEI